MWRLMRKLLFAVAAGALILAVGISVYSWMAMRSLTREIESTSRDPQTGIVLGAEPINIGPEDATAACLLIHGYVGARSDFADLGERLSEQGFYVRMARLPGHGTTPDDYARQTPDTILDGARDELEDLRSRFERVYIVGFSMGGAVSTLLTAESGADGLVLIAPFYDVTYSWRYLLPPETWNALMSPAIAYFIKSDAFTMVNRREAVEHIYSYRTVPTQGVKTLVEIGRRASRPEILGKIVCPVLVLHSEGDEAASPQASASAFALIASKDKRIRWFSKRSNHHLFWDYDAKDAVAEVIGFLEQLEGAENKVTSFEDAAPE